MSISDLKKVGGCLTPYHSQHPLYLNCLCDRYRELAKNIKTESTDSMRKSFRQLAALSLLMARTAKRNKLDIYESLINAWHTWKTCGNVIGNEDA